ncbi:bifunctional 2-polyprenyl-6-hydroxyphenol methylase/3-demethylubiquinol 3-O-methyltransferase UbiG [Fusibacter sp. 3D3]|uniref:class I SAM-dependent methyltransferase n=1 Tax=Fusibacter sp. 3D3 TaxID=1048380 RepID=UPI000852AEC4|nr:class I SAM-dependent methyltransferase [Fusibacter sp. 3D3]GAU78892.1 SAM-dependent methyltransferases [Fusibacter sp. 3D3]
MMFLWKPKMIDYMKDAYEFHSAHHRLAENVEAYLPKLAHVCDAGCGLGYFSLALANRCEYVTAVDIAHSPLEILRENVNQLGYQNIEIIEGDILQKPPVKPYDAMVFSFFGTVNETLKIAKEQCNGTVLMLKKNSAFHRVSLTKQVVGRHTYKSTREQLEQYGMPFRYESFSIEMGQPFKSIETAVDFFKLYCRDGHPEAIGIADVADKLIRSTSDVFPYYLPMAREVGLVVLNTEDIPGDIE